MEKYSLHESDAIPLPHCQASSARCSVRNAEKQHRRYQGQAWPFAVEHRGRLGGKALELLDILAREAALTSGMRPSTLARKWKRQLHLVTAFEVAEIMRGQLCGLADVSRASDGQVANSQGRRYKPSSPAGACDSSSSHQPVVQVGLAACALRQPLPCFGSSSSSGSAVAST